MSKVSSEKVKGELCWLCGSTERLTLHHLKTPEIKSLKERKQLGIILHSGECIVMCRNCHDKIEFLKAIRDTLKNLSKDIAKMSNSIAAFRSEEYEYLCNSHQSEELACQDEDRYTVNSELGSTDSVGLDESGIASSKSSGDTKIKITSRNRQNKKFKALFYSYFFEEGISKEKSDKIIERIVKDFSIYLMDRDAEKKHLEAIIRKLKSEEKK